MRKLSKILGWSIAVHFSVLIFYSCQYVNRDRYQRDHVGDFSTGASLTLKKNSFGLWGIAVENAGSSSLSQSEPFQIEYYKDSTTIIKESAGYESFSKGLKGFTGKSAIKIGNASFHVTDSWTIAGNVLRLSRKVIVNGNAPGGFLSAVTFDNDQPVENVQYFAPGMVFGDRDHLTKVAIGGQEAGNITWIREDRLPAPLFGIFAKDGTSVTILDPSPQGHTTREDSHDKAVTTLIDSRFRFGAIGAEAKEEGIRIGFKWPGTEGETTYRGYHYPGGQVHKWRRRYHPVNDGFGQGYEVSFKLGKGDEKFVDYYTNAWRWAWEVLQPQVNPQDIEAARRSLIDMLAERVETHGNVTGIVNHTLFADKKNASSHRKTIMGFAGKTLESANFLLQNAEYDQRPEANEHRRKGLAIINSFLHLNLSPPEGIGFWFDTGKPAAGVHGLIYLRYIGDGLKALLKAAKREQEHGRKHPEWIAWSQSFGEWLLPQQTPPGGFPRAWDPKTGKIADASLQSSYMVIPYLLLLSELTGEDKYREAAVRAGEFCWNSNGQAEGIFVGGTVDNPDVVDKEAGTLSLEAHIALYDATKDKKWLDRARIAANFSESWMYIWNVPMPEDEQQKDLHWKKGVSTVGLQLISTGHSLTDAYMAFDADEFAKLAVLTGDDHYMDVAAILLHNTKGMLGLPHRTYDLPGTGWQQEHWSLAPERGLGRKRAWLPWVSTSHLNGIFGLMEFDQFLFKQLLQKGNKSDSCSRRKNL